MRESRYARIPPDWRKLGRKDVEALKKTADYLKFNRDILKFIEDYPLNNIVWNRQEPGYRFGLRFAAKHDRKILLAFTGLSHCPPCQTLEYNVFESDLFNAWALEEKLVLINIDDLGGLPGPEPGEGGTSTPEDAALFSEYDVYGYANATGSAGLPTVFALASDGSRLGSITGGNSDPRQWIADFLVVLNRA